MTISINGNQVSATSGLGALMQSNAVLQAYITARGTNAAAVATWWSSLTAAQQVHFIIDLTLLIEHQGAELRTIRARLQRAGL